jgi:hypothetical protein
LVCSVKHNLGVCLGHGFNRDIIHPEVNIGEQINVSICGFHESANLYQFVRVPE